MNKAIGKSVVTPSEAKALVAQERQQRGRMCSDEINAILERHRCKLEWIEVKRNGRLVEARWRIVPLE